jgi:hypothetical protein
MRKLFHSVKVERRKRKTGKLMDLREYFLFNFSSKGKSCKKSIVELLTLNES